MPNYVTLPVVVNNTNYPEMYTNSVKTGEDATYYYRAGITGQATALYSELRMAKYVDGSRTYFVVAGTPIQTSNNSYLLNFTKLPISLTADASLAYGSSGVISASNTYGDWNYTANTISNASVLSELTAYGTLSEALDAISAGEEPPVYQGVVVQVTGALIDPMDEGGTSGEELPDGDFDDETDEIPEPTLPSIGAQNSGMISLFRPSLEQVHSLGEYLWTHLDDFIENFQKFFTNPMDYIISFHIVPYVPSVGKERAINIGNFLTTIELPPCVSQWYTFDFGSVQLTPYSGTYLDYSPYTKIQLMLPFIGSVTLNTDEVMSHNVGIKYKIDNLSGQFVALVSIDGSYRYQYTGECAVPVPLTGSNWSRVYSAVAGAIGTAITGGISAVGGAGVGTGLAWRQASSGATKSASNALDTYRRISKSAPEMREQARAVADAAVRNAVGASQEIGNTARSIQASRVANTVNNTVGAVMGAKQFVSHSGSMTGAAGMLGIRQPFIVVEYPNQSLAENYKKFVGYPANISGKLSEFTGYTECEQVIPNGFSGTDTELGELLELLKGGIYL